VPGAAASTARSGPALLAARTAARANLPAPAEPIRITIDATRTSAPVVPVGILGSGELELPQSAQHAGWWIGSAGAGDRHNAVILAGHVDAFRQGLGAFAALRYVPIGTRIVLTDVFGTAHAYVVEARRTYRKYDLPADVFRVSGTSRLVLITCGGPFDRRVRHYRDNLVVYAVPVTGGRNGASSRV
jgi:hypothetical protein